MIMTFGKYQGIDIELIPSNYLKWFFENINSDSDYLEKLILACEEEYNFREKYRDHFFEIED